MDTYIYLHGRSTLCTLSKDYWCTPSKMWSLSPLASLKQLTNLLLFGTTGVTTRCNKFLISCVYANNLWQKSTFVRYYFSLILKIYVRQIKYLEMNIPTRFQGEQLVYILIGGEVWLDKEKKIK